MCIVRPRPAARLNSPRGASAQAEGPSRRSADSIPFPGRPETGKIIRFAAKVRPLPLHEAEADAASSARVLDFAQTPRAGPSNLREPGCLRYARRPVGDSAENPG